MVKTCLNLIFNFLFMLLNIFGTILWINMYIAGQYTAWWIFVIIFMCGFAAIIFAEKFIKSIRALYKIKII